MDSRSIIETWAGRATDTEVAQAAGVGRKAVIAYRSRAGIPPYCVGPTTSAHRAPAGLVADHIARLEHERDTIDAELAGLRALA